MTYVGPYSMATDFSDYYISGPKPVKVATPGTLLDAVARHIPGFLPIIKIANQEAFYDEIGYDKYTLFGPNHRRYPFLDPDTAYRICKMATVKGSLNMATLTSSKLYTLESLSPQNTLLVDNTPNKTTINGHRVIMADIVCKNGIIHVIDDLLWPNY